MCCVAGERVSPIYFIYLRQWRDEQRVVLCCVVLCCVVLCCVVCVAYSDSQEESRGGGRPLWKQQSLALQKCASFSAHRSLLFFPPLRHPPQQQQHTPFGDNAERTKRERERETPTPHSSRSLSPPPPAPQPFHSRLPVAFHCSTLWISFPTMLTYPVPPADRQRRQPCDMPRLTRHVCISFGSSSTCATLNASR